MSSKLGTNLKVGLKVIAIKSLGGKQNGGLPELIYSNPLTNPDYRTADQLAVKYSVFEDHYI